MLIRPQLVTRYRLISEWPRSSPQHWRLTSPSWQGRVSASSSTPTPFQTPRPSTKTRKTCSSLWVSISVGGGMIPRLSPCGSIVPGLSPCESIVPGLFQYGSVKPRKSLVFFLIWVISRVHVEGWQRWCVCVFTEQQHDQVTYHTCAGTCS